VVDILSCLLCMGQRRRKIGEKGPTKRLLRVKNFVDLRTGGVKKKKLILGRYVENIRFQGGRVKRG